VPSELRICVIVNPALPPGLLANTVAAIGIGSVLQRRSLPALG